MSVSFAGSVFVFSDKFVNSTNAPKSYFVMMSLTVTIALLTVSGRYIRYQAIKSKPILWGAIIICFLQACYGLFQFIGWLPSNHSSFVVTGSFDNPNLLFFRQLD